MKKILIIGANAYALGGILSNLNLHFCKENQVYFLINNFFINEDKFIEFLKEGNKKNIEKFFIFKNYNEFSYQKLSAKIIKKNLDVIIENFKRENIEFDEIIISELYSAEYKYLIDKISKKKTLLSFMDLHFVDRDLIYKYLLNNNQITLNKPSIIYLFRRFRYDFKISKILKNFINCLIEFSIFGHVSHKRSYKSFLRPNHLIHKDKFNKKIKKLYLLYENYKQIYQNAYRLENISYELLQNNNCKCEKNKKLGGLIIVPYLSRDLFYDVISRKNSFKRYIEKKVNYFFEKYKIDTFYFRFHPRDDTNFDNELLTHLKKKYSYINFLKQNDSLLNLNYFCQFKFIFGSSSLVGLASKNCNNIISISSYYLYVIERMYPNSNEKMFFKNQYDLWSHDKKNKKIFILD